MFFIQNADVPRGTIGFMRIISLIIISLCLLACNKPEKNPELRDPIHSAIEAELKATDVAIAGEQKTLADHEKTLADVVPQTGQIKYAQKRVRESKERLTKLLQEKQYLELKKKARARDSKKSYLAAFKKGETWPDPKEWDSYQAEERLRKAKRTWDVQERIKQAGLGNEKAGSAPAPSGH
ncbi:baseplate J/gp47 family protein [Bdellovibrio reynosensis]|uniref:Lipoprotein n=1 Tax=Bdellovibrio reynosensis TaxID=2835041 RepID=A0ABY4C683_9BACT|nr:hypothetical protein [Bdellovibrio reynosensis]UOF00405.1 hypothetical protein MNR06_11920 [Bdellovibrio reynosensis]